MYPASVLDVATNGCLLDFQETALLFKKNTSPVVDRREPKSLAHDASAKPSSFSFRFPTKKILYFTVVVR